MEHHPKPPGSAAEGQAGPERQRHWGRMYFGVLVHLGLWIGLLWWISRAYGSEL